MSTDDHSDDSKDTIEVLQLAADEPDHIPADHRSQRWLYVLVALLIVLNVILMVGMISIYTGVVSSDVITPQSSDASLPSDDSIVRALEEQMEFIRSDQIRLRDLLEQTLQQKETRSTQTVLLTEAAWLIRLAQYQTHGFNDVGLAGKTIHTAIARLQKTGIAGKSQIITLLKEDLGTLQQIDESNVHGLVLYLQNAQAQTKKLQLKTEQPSESPQAQTSDADNTEQLSLWAMIKDEFQAMVTIEQRSADSDTAWSEKMRVVHYPYDHLRVELANARLAALQRDTDGLHASIATLLQLLEDYFVANEAANTLRNSLTEMRTVDLNPVLPDFSAALDQINILLDTPATELR